MRSFQASKSVQMQLDSLTPPRFHFSYLSTGNKSEGGELGYLWKLSTGIATLENQGPDSWEGCTLGMRF